MTGAYSRLIAHMAYRRASNKSNYIASQYHADMPLIPCSFKARTTGEMGRQPLRWSRVGTSAVCSYYSRSPVYDSSAHPHSAPPRRPLEMQRAGQLSLSAFNREGNIMLGEEAHGVCLRMQARKITGTGEVLLFDRNYFAYDRVPRSNYERVPRKSK